MLADRADWEQILGAYLKQYTSKEEIPNLHHLQQRFDQEASRVLPVDLEKGCSQYVVSCYDALLSRSQELHV